MGSQEERRAQVSRLRQRALEDLRWIKEDGARWVRDGVDETAQLVARAERNLRECDAFLAACD